jgi:methyl-accepting chemotaxis protein
MNKTTEIVFIIFTVVISVSVLIQSIAILGMFLAARKTREKIHFLVEELRVHAVPAMSTSRALVEDLSPKLKIITSNLVESSDKIRAMTGEISGVVSDVSQRTRAQAAHVDGMVEGTLEQITHATSSIQHGIAVPVRQLTGILNALRAGLNVMFHKPPPRNLAAEDDLFI